MNRIEHASNLRDVSHLQADVVIVGSGAGGAMAASELGRRGAHVIVLEQGAALDAQQDDSCDAGRGAKIFEDQIVRSTADRTIRVLCGSCVGGSTVHSLALFKRLPDAVLERWRRDHAVSGIDPGELAQDFEAVERELGVRQIEASRRNANNRILERGVNALGWRGGPLNHNRLGCRESGLCSMGCPFNAKRSAADVLIPTALEHGACVIAGARVERVLHDGQSARGVSFLAADSEVAREITVHAPAVVLAASALGSAALALRSALPDPHAQLGRGLRLQPSIAVAGRFNERIETWQGIPQSYECTEWLDFEEPSRKRIWIASGYSAVAGSALPVAMEEGDWQRRAAHLATLTATLRDQTSGRVWVRDQRSFIDYRLSRADAEHLAGGVRACCELLFGAGALEVLVPARNPIVLREARELRSIMRRIARPGELPLVAAHPMGSLRMGDDPRRAVVKSTSEHHQLRGLFVLDGSLFPTSLGVPPQLSIYALVRQLSRHVATRLGAQGRQL